MPEISHMKTTMDGPASRHGQFGETPADDSSVDEDAEEHGRNHTEDYKPDSHGNP